MRFRMPAHYEMLVSHSPPVFSHSPPTGFLSDYSTNNRLYDSRSFCRPQVLASHQTPLSLLQNRRNLQTLSLKMPSLPKRSCLVIKADGETSPETETIHTQNEHKTKKKVVFADDQGHALTEIRIMSEPSNVPPLWSIKFLEHVTQGLISPVPPEQWTITFRQPASDYLDFRRKLDNKNVSLENVIVKENDSVIVGTVKVKNLSYHKEVIVRASWDDWKSQEDTFCIYSQIGASGGTYVLYDTFSFKLTLPPMSKKLEFCVCFRANGVEHWDNNDGKNYIINKRTSSFPDNSEVQLKLNNCDKDSTKAVSNPINVPQKYADITQAKIASWSEFASWNHLENNSPYW